MTGSDFALIQHLFAAPPFRREIRPWPARESQDRVVHLGMLQNAKGERVNLGKRDGGACDEEFVLVALVESRNST